jgi:tRNA acetyltransferase TAN1
MCGVPELQRFNILVGCPRDRERAAKSEVQYFIGDLLNDESLCIEMTVVSGLITCLTSLDPFQTINSLRTFAAENPYQFRFALRFTPVERCVPTSLENIVQAATDLRPRIEPHESFRVTVRKRHSSIDTMELIEAVAAQFPMRVSLENPDRNLWIEVVGESTGVAVLRPRQDILSIAAMRGNAE